ncbi:hypothetical protein L0244_36565 [bacterium]|nr:hypothetical protein [bacterium]
MIAAGPIAVAITAAIAFIERAFWTNHYSKAKEAEISAIKAQLEAVRELSPVKVKEAYDALQDMLSKHNDVLKEKNEELQQQVNTLEEELKTSKQTIEQLKTESSDSVILGLLNSLDSQTTKMKSETNQIRQKINEYHKRFIYVSSDINSLIKVARERAAFEGLSTMPKKKEDKKE